MGEDPDSCYEKPPVGADPHHSTAANLTVKIRRSSPSPSAVRSAHLIAPHPHRIDAMQALTFAVLALAIASGESWFLMQFCVAI